LGQPGAGKTTALLHIALELIDAASISSEAPVPVIANLSKFRLLDRTNSASLVHWDREKKPSRGDQSRDVERWLISEMTLFPGMDQDTASRWLKDGRVAALLDGLDEFNDDRRADLARALNTTFLRENAEIPIVICSRTNEYEALRTGDGTRLELQGSVELQPLSGDQIVDYLKAARTQGLLDALSNDSALRELAKTPLCLSILVLAYGGNVQADFVPSSSVSETRFKMFESYVGRMLQRQARRQKGIAFDDVRANDISTQAYRYNPDAVNRWLGWLALTLSIRMRTSFSIVSLVRLLVARTTSSQDKTNKWIAYQVIGIQLLFPMLIVGLTIFDWTIAGTVFMLSTLLISMMVFPINMILPRNVDYGRIIFVCLFLFAAVMLYARLVADWSFGDSFVFTATPLVVIMSIVCILLFDKSDRNCSPYFGVMGAAN